MVCSSASERREIVDAGRARRSSSASARAAPRLWRRSPVSSRQRRVVVADLLRLRGRASAAAASRILRSVSLLRSCSSSNRPQLGAVGRHRVVLDPAAAGELIEVGAGVGGLVERIELQARGQTGREQAWRGSAAGRRRTDDARAASAMWSVRRRHGESPSDRAARERTDRPYATYRPLPSARSPDPAGAGANHRRVRLARERLRKLRHVRHRSVDAVLVRRVRVGRGLAAARLPDAHSRTRPAPSRGRRAAPA